MDTEIHFRGELEVIQFDALYKARDWLSSRRKPPQPPMLEVDATLSETATEAVHLAEALHVNNIAPLDEVVSEQGKYAPLTIWLQSQKSGSQAIITLAKLEGLLGAPLPTSARTYSVVPYSPKRNSNRQGATTP